MKQKFRINFLAYFLYVSLLYFSFRFVSIPRFLFCFKAKINTSCLSLNFASKYLFSLTFVRFIRFVSFASLFSFRFAFSLHFLFVSHVKHTISRRTENERRTLTATSMHCYLRAVLHYAIPWLPVHYSREAAPAVHDAELAVSMLVALTTLQHLTNHSRPGERTFLLGRTRVHPCAVEHRMNQWHRLPASSLRSFRIHLRVPRAEICPRNGFCFENFAKTKWPPRTVVIHLGSSFHWAGRVYNGLRSLRIANLRGIMRKFCNFAIIRIHWVCSIYLYYDSWRLGRRQPLVTWLGVSLEARHFPILVAGLPIDPAREGRTTPHSWQRRTKLRSIQAGEFKCDIYAKTTISSSGGLHEATSFLALYNLNFVMTNKITKN